MNRLLTTLLFLWAVSQLHATASDVRITHFDERNGFTESYVTTVLQDRDGLIWVSSWNGLSRYDGYRFETYKGRPGDGCPLGSNRINGIAELSEHEILCRSNDRYYVFDKSAKTFHATDDRHKTLIKVYHLPEEMKKRILNLPEYAHIEVKFLCTDRQGGVWVQSNRGLERVWFVRKSINPEKFGEDGEEAVRGLYRDRKGRLWIADKNGVVRVYDSINSHLPLLRQRPLFLTPSGQLTSSYHEFGSNVYTFCEDGQGNMWLGTKPDGLYRLQSDGGGYKVTQYLHRATDPWSLSSNSIYDVKSGTDGRLLVATFDGGLNIACTQADGGIRFIHPQNKLRQFPAEAMQCRCLLLTADGTLLIGTTNGLLSCRLMEDERLMKFYLNRRDPNKKSTLSSNYINGMLLTRSGEVLIATSGGGVDRIAGRDLLGDALQFEHFSNSEGLMSDMALALQEDRLGRVWVVSEASLSCIDHRYRKSVNYLKGFFSSRFSFTEVPPLSLPDGRIVVGTTKGTLTFDVLQMTKSSYVPPILFSSGNTIMVEGGRKNVDVRFAALDYNKTEDIVYAYKLEGIDNQWRYTTLNELHYVILQPGTYTLRVRSTNGDGVWVNNERTVQIYRKAMFTETAFFWILTGLLAAAFGYGIYKLWTYVRHLQEEIRDIQMTSEEKIAVLGNRIRELLVIGETVEMADTDAEKELHSPDDHLFAQRLKAYIIEHLDQSDLQVIDLAHAMSVSRTRLFTKVKRIFNCSPNNLVLNLRIEKAKQWLSEGQMPVADVAYKCGFSDPKYFSRCFKKLTGKQPTAWKA